MPEQLSIFDELFEQANQSSETPMQITEPEQQDSTIMEPITEILMNDETVHQEEIYIGQKVKLKMPKDKECEVYQYMYYYCSHLLKKVGEIEEVKETPQGKSVCTVNFHGEIVYFHSNDLNFL